MNIKVLGYKLAVINIIRFCFYTGKTLLQNAQLQFSLLPATVIKNTTLLVNLEFVVLCFRKFACPPALKVNLQHFY